MNAHVSLTPAGPRDETQTATILRLALQGLKRKQIAAHAGIDYVYVGAIIYKLRQRGLLAKPEKSWSDEELEALRDCILVKGMGGTAAAAFLSEQFGRPLSRKMIVSMCVRRGWRAGAADGAAQGGLREINKTRSWPDAHLAALREMALVERLSGAATAAALSEKFGREFTRNSVIGMARRLCLSFTAPTGRPRRDPTLPAAGKPRDGSRASRRAKPTKPAKVNFVEELEHWEPRRLTLLAVREGDCRFPLGDPGAEGFAFCGVPTQPGKVYCAHCVRIAYETPAQRAAVRKAWHEARGLPA